MAIIGTVPPLFRVRQGVQVDNGVSKMLQEGDNRWIYTRKGQVLFLNDETYEIIRIKGG